MCFKGRQAAEAHHGDARLIKPLSRTADGAFESIALESALDEIGARLRTLIETHGPQSVAVFCGNGSVFNKLASVAQRDFLAAIGSHQMFTSITIDQPAKYVSIGRLGVWQAGYHAFENMDTCVMFGANPLVSHASLQFLTADPVRRLRIAKDNGMRLVVVDPRRTETAALADVYLQPRPGEDAAIAAGLLRIMLAERWYDRDFCTRWVGDEGMTRLRAAVEPFDEVFVERRAGLEAGQLRSTAEVFGRDGRTGAAHCATGTDMAPFSNLAQHLIDTLNVVGGRFLRAGDRLHTADPWAPEFPLREGVVPATRPWEAAGPSRIRGAKIFFGERCSGTLADEILEPGDDQIHALIVDGGNVLTSLPDQRRALSALRSLDLLVSIDGWHTPTTREAHYVILRRCSTSERTSPFIPRRGGSLAGRVDSVHRSRSAASARLRYRR